MNYDTKKTNRRVLVVDDTAMIHEDFQKVLLAAPERSSLDLAESELFGDSNARRAGASFELASAYQGEEGVRKVQDGQKAGQPFAVAFVDVRMPPGIDGVQATKRMLEIDPRIQIVLCTAYSDHSWLDITETVGETDRLLILKKPFDAIEIRQMALSLSVKWNLTLAGSQTRDELQDQIASLAREINLTSKPMKKVS